MHVRTQARTLAKAALAALPDFADRVRTVSQQSQIDTSRGAFALLATPAEAAELMTTGGSYVRQIELKIAVFAQRGASETLEDEIDRLSVLVEKAVLEMDPEKALAHRVSYQGAEIDTQTGGTETDGDVTLTFAIMLSTAKNNPELSEV